MNKRLRKAILAMVAASLTLSFAAGPVLAGSKDLKAVRYMPDVNAKMSNYTYWAEKVKNPDEVLMSAEEIKTLDREHLSAMKNNDTPMYDLENWSEETFNGVSFVNSLKSGARSDGAYFLDGCGARWRETGSGAQRYTSVDEAFGEDIANCVDPDATESMNVKYAVCTKRTALTALPTEKPILDDPNDPDFDYRYLSVVNVNDPLVLKTKSADGKFYLAYSTCSSGWIPAAEVAICQSKDEWYDAWKCDDDKKLIVYADRITTEESNSTPEVSNKTLYMGTALVLADEEDINGRINNRSAHNNHVVWMPVRNDDGSYRKTLALIGENRKVSEGYLPLTTSNIMMVALNQLGNCYGWGGMLGSDDCSGYMRDIYSCFGLELARSTSEHEMGFLKNYHLSVRRDNGSWDLNGITDEKKAEIVKKLPPGSILDISGHEMMYLGHEGENYYVISSISSVVIPGDSSTTRIRNVIINTLDMRRGNGNTWLHELKYAIVPYYYADTPYLSDAEVSGIKTKTYTGKKITQSPKVVVDGKELKEGEDYSVTYKNNVNAGNALITIKGTGKCKGELDLDFTISKAKNTLNVKGKTVKLKAATLKKKAQKLAVTKAVTFKNKGQGTKTYKKAGGNAKIVIDKKTGKVTVKKGLKKGSYKVKMKIKAAGSKNYKASAVKTVTFKITVK